MIINATIDINPLNGRMIDGLQEVINLIYKINRSRSENVSIDFSNTKFVSPLFIVPLMVYLRGTSIKLENIPEYMRTIGFSSGIRPDDMRRSEFVAHMEKYVKKTYIPIINFPATAKLDDEKNAIISTVESIIVRQLDISPNVAGGFKYLVGENVDNIIEHAQSERGYIFAQAYPQMHYVDVCVADNGITLLGSYKTLPNNKISTDIDAIQAANRGESTKNLPNAENRGYGIVTSKKMLIDGLGGSFIMMSGSAIYVKNKTIDQFINLPEHLKWNGTIVALRMPYTNKQFQYVKYIE